METRRARPSPQSAASSPTSLPQQETRFLMHLSRGLVVQNSIFFYLIYFISDEINPPTSPREGIFYFEDIVAGDSSEKVLFEDIVAGRSLGKVLFLKIL